MFEHNIFGPDALVKLDDEEHKTLQLLESEIKRFIAEYSRSHRDSYKGFMNVPLNPDLFGKISVPGQRMLIRVARNAGWRAAEIRQNDGVPYLCLKE